MKRIMISILSFSLATAQVGYSETMAKRVFLERDLRQVATKSGLAGKSITYKQFYQNIKDELPEKYRADWHAMLFPYSNQQTPRVNFQWQEQSNGEATNPKVIINHEGESFVFEASDNPNQAYRVNGVMISVDELHTDGGREKILQALPSDKRYTTAFGLVHHNRLLTPDWLTLAKKESAVKYFTTLRKLHESVLAVNHAYDMNPDKNSPPKTASLDSFFLNCLLPKASASGNWVGQPCVAAGWVASYVQVGSRITCDITKAANYSSINCGSNTVGCDPAIFGRSNNGQVNYTGKGGAFCVHKDPDGSYRQATMHCHKHSTIEQLVAGLHAKGGGDPKKVAAEFEAYNNLLISTISHCDSPPANTLGDQNQACEALEQRLLEFKAVKDEIVTGIAPGDRPPLDGAPKTGNQSGGASFLPVVGFGMLAMVLLLRKGGKKKSKPTTQPPPADPDPKDPDPKDPDPKDPPVNPPPPTTPKAERVEKQGTGTPGGRLTPYNSGPTVN